MESDTTTPPDEQATGLTPAPPTPDETADAGASSAPDESVEADANVRADAIVLEASLESFPSSDAPAWTARRGTP